MSLPEVTGAPAPAVVGVQVGRARIHRFAGRTVRSAVAKEPVRGTVRILAGGLEGDVQVHRRFHGGPDRAVCVYPAAHLASWSRELGRPLLPGRFGENLTVVGLDEHAVHIGDRYRFGTALLEITQPREPCRTLAGWLGVPTIVSLIAATFRTGWYCRVVEPGEGSRGLAFEREYAHPARISVAEALRIKRDPASTAAEVRRLLAVGALSEGWQRQLSRRADPPDPGTLL